MVFNKKVFLSKMMIIEKEYNEWFIKNQDDKAQNLTSISDLYYIFYDGNQYVLRFSRQNIPDDLRKKIISSFDSSHTSQIQY